MSDTTDTNDDHGQIAAPHREPVGWTMWSVATIVGIAGLVLASISLGRDNDGSSSATSSGGKAPTAEPTGAQIDFQAKPGADWVPYDPTLKPAPGGTEHAITMHAIEKVMEVAPGVTQEMWTFDGVVPGTTLRGDGGAIATDRE